MAERKGLDKTAAKAAKIDAEIRNIAIATANAMEAVRAEDLLLLDIRGIADYADFFIIATASSTQRLHGIAKAADKALIQAGRTRLSRLVPETSWTLLDHGDIIVHIFEPAAREFYRLEDLWGDAPRVEWQSAPARKE
ncbi:MAG: ribosome silencing factor [Planctomycetota bacterium]|jgi:ribosome-associated protein|nr:ribosome silencing factor [Planctomycetota bacterium]